MFSIIQALITNLLLWIWIGTALFLWWITRENKRFRRYGFCFLLLFWVMSTKPVADAVLWPLESSYIAPSISSLKVQGIERIVVLAGGGGLKTEVSDPQITQITQKEKEQVSRPSTISRSYGAGNGAKSLRGKEDEGTEGEGRKTEVGGQKSAVRSLISTLPHATAYRLWGAFELVSRLGPNCSLIFVGSPNGDTRAMAELAQILMPDRKVVSKPHWGGTSEHPKNVKSSVGKRAFILVTSAMHMKRAMWCFELQGLHPVPYPVDFLSGGGYRWTDVFPSMENLWKLGVVFREYLALGWYWMIAADER